MTQLHQAAFQGDIQALENLLNCEGIDINARDLSAKNSPTALHEAVMGESTPAVEMLLHYGADVNAKDAHGCTPLHLAAYWSNVKIVEILLHRGADVNVLDARGFTPLRHAVDMENAEAQELLSERGAPMFLDRVHSSREAHKGFSR